jgi:hypothetical protein
MNFLLCSSRKSPRLLALLRFFAELFDREYGGDLSSAIRTFFSLSECNSDRISPMTPTPNSSECGSPGSNSPMLPRRHADPETSSTYSDKLLSPRKTTIHLSDSESEVEPKKPNKAGICLRPADLMLCSLGPCNSCGGTIMAHIRAISCPGCGPLHQCSVEDCRQNQNRSQSRKEKRKHDFSGSTINPKSRHKSLFSQSKSALDKDAPLQAPVSILNSKNSPNKLLSPTDHDELDSPELMRADDDNSTQSRDLDLNPSSLAEDARNLVGAIRVRCCG